MEPRTPQTTPQSSPIAEIKKRQDTYSYRGWLVSDLFWKRAAAVYGHYLVAGLVISVLFFLLITIVAVLALAAGLASHMLF